MRRRPHHVRVRAGQFEFVKLNTQKSDLRDTYHLVLTLNWPWFSALIFSIYLLINVVFASLYLAQPGAIAEMRPHSFLDAFFFSVETLATVGYGHMYPETFYGHLITMLEIMVGLFGLAVITGLIFVRFSRPTARMHFSKVAVIAPFDGVPTLMIRLANLRHQAMVEPQFHMILLRTATTVEGEDTRRFYPLKLQFDHLIAFPAVLTIRHQIDEASPLFGLNPEDFQRLEVRLMASIVGVDSVIVAPVQSGSDYNYDQIEWNRRFVEIYDQTKEREWTVDYGRIDETEDLPPEQQFPHWSTLGLQPAAGEALRQNAYPPIRQAWRAEVGEQGHPENPGSRRVSDGASAYRGRDNPAYRTGASRRLTLTRRSRDRARPPSQNRRTRNSRWSNDSNAQSANPR
jgi:inward rectifier potassium channel